MSPDYFRTMGISLSGRDFLPSDRAGSPEVAILNENLARRLFGNRNPVGHTFRYTDPRVSDPVTVVGVAKNSKYFNLRVPGSSALVPLSWNRCFFWQDIFR